MSTYNLCQVIKENLFFLSDIQQAPKLTKPMLSLFSFPGHPRPHPDPVLLRGPLRRRHRPPSRSRSTRSRNRCKRSTRWVYGRKAGNTAVECTIWVICWRETRDMTKIFQPLLIDFVGRLKFFLFNELYWADWACFEDSWHLSLFIFCALWMRISSTEREG